jgi:hypothetical protein
MDAMPVPRFAANEPDEEVADGLLAGLVALALGIGQRTAEFGDFELGLPEDLRVMPTSIGLDGPAAACRARDVAAGGRQP